MCYLQSPLTTTAALEEAVHTLVANNADSSFTAEEITSPLFARTPHGLIPINRSGYLHSDFNAVFREVKNVFAVRNKVVRSGSIIGARSVHFLVSEEESFFISSRRDLELARFLVRAEGAPEPSHANKYTSALLALSTWVLSAALGAGTAANGF